MHAHEVFVRGDGTVRQLKSDSPHLMIIAGGKAALADQTQLLEARCARIFLSKNEVRRAIGRYVQERSTRSSLRYAGHSRLSAATPDHSPQASEVLKTKQHS